MFSKKIVLFIAFIFVSFKFNAQSCNLTIKGSVFDEAPKTPLSYVNIFIQELAQGTTSDDKGNFLFDNICPGEYHLIFSHIGCEGEKIHLDLTSDTTITILLSHTPTSLGVVLIKGKKDEFNNQPNLSVNRQAIEDNSNQNLSSLLENEAGVHLLKNGSGISKPVVHGLYGNRLIILNNGIVQSGQQWGNDHSPEIDPFAADKITVLKGTSAIEYGGGNLGSVILVEPKRIEREPHLHGQVNYAFETNGRGHSLNTRFEKYAPSVAWRINGTLKKYGDKKTANYFLNNTGIKEVSFAIQLEKSWKDKLFLDFYGSTFNTQLGILRGAHIGNLSDLEEALTNDVPFFTEPDFSYEVDAPKQNVSHHLAKGKAKYFLKNNQIIEFIIAGQINNRKEFDVRRSGRSDIPALSLSQYAFNSELKYTGNLGENWKLKTGNQNIATDNTNNPETGILPLIPDYFSWKSGLFITLSKRMNKTDFNFGIRYDYEHQNVLTISRSLPREIIKFENQYHNISSLLAAKVDISKTQSISWNTGYAMRNPAINELYSNGLHQGVSGIEEGDINLVTEKALKNTLEYKWTPNGNFSFNTLLYHQHFKNYIFLNPQDEIRLTIRGAFPIFRYEQTDASIYGLDISTQFTIGHSLFGLLKYSYLRGDDTKNNRPLVFMPPNSFFGSLIYRAKKPIKLFKNITMEESEIEINYRLVLKQNNILPEQDFVSPPPTYNLFGLKISTNIISSNYKIRCFVKADNLLNVGYRDYLNRQRYFADDIGLSITFGVNYKF
ncbi:MAG: iron complex outermembrane receptor protein [Saprospiraceae bacterium]|jgi:iron complex outermembrane receptor protein